MTDRSKEPYVPPIMPLAFEAHGEPMHPKLSMPFVLSQSIDIANGVAVLSLVSQPPGISVVVTYYQKTNTFRVEFGPANGFSVPRDTFVVALNSIVLWLKQLNKTWHIGTEDIMQINDVSLPQIHAQNDIGTLAYIHDPSSSSYKVGITYTALMNDADLFVIYWNPMSDVISLEQKTPVTFTLGDFVVRIRAIIRFISFVERWT